MTEFESQTIEKILEIRRRQLEAAKDRLGETFEILSSGMVKGPVKKRVASSFSDLSSSLSNDINRLEEGL